MLKRPVNKAQGLLRCSSMAGACAHPTQRATGPEPEQRQVQLLLLG